MKAQTRNRLDLLKYGMLFIISAMVLLFLAYKAICLLSFVYRGF
jgi:hypothetical protein